MNYLTQKDVLRYFRDNISETELKVFISFVGNYKIEGRHGATQSFAVIEPTYLIFKYDRGGLMDALYGGADLDNEEKDPFNGIGCMFSSNRNNDPLYPLNSGLIKHFNNSIDIYDGVGKKALNGNIIDRIKFFDSMEQAELNFVILLREYLNQNKLLEALSTYDKIIDKHKITNPSDLIKHL